MKKLIYALGICLALIVSEAHAQETIVMVEGQFTRPFERNESLNLYQWGSYNYYGKKSLGVVAFVTHSAGVYSIAGGPTLFKELREGKWSLEGAIGPGIDMAKGHTNASMNAYVEFFSKASVDVAPGKVSLYYNPYYSKAYGFSQMAWFMVDINKIFSVGVYDQTDAVRGVRVKATFDPMNVAVTVGKNSAMFTIAMVLKSEK